MKITSFFSCLLFVSALSLVPPLWAANEIQDAYTGTNPQREYTETNSLFNVLRETYRPSPQAKPTPSVQAPYQRIAPPKWGYYGTPPKTEPEKKRPASVDGRYYKPTPEPEKKRSSRPSIPHNP